MKKLLILFLCFPIVLLSQTSSHELQFSSSALSYVEMPNTSLLIANKNAFSISGWVYPEIDNSHNGLFGFRNNTNADFYLLQLTNTNNIEARFRNSNSDTFNIIAINSLVLNQWQHLAFTYDHDTTTIKTYLDGELETEASDVTDTPGFQQYIIGTNRNKSKGLNIIIK